MMGRPSGSGRPLRHGMGVVSTITEGVGVAFDALASANDDAPENSWDDVV